MGNEAMGGATSARPAYLLDNAGKETPIRFAGLSAMFDAGTVGHLEQRGVGPGWHCLEVGAGGGTIARWLAHRVGSTGRVLATDIDPRFLESLDVPNLEVQRHDIRADPVPQGAFDLVHARLVLMHLPERDKVLQRLISALKPGGWLVDEEYDAPSTRPDPAASPGESLLKTHLAMWKLMEDRGIHLRYGRLLFGRLRAHGLTDVGAEGRVFMSHWGSPGASTLRANYEQLREALIGGSYVTQQQFDEDMARLDDPEFMMPSPILWSAWGRRH
jgi:SAM-dependent methyltransferase